MANRIKARATPEKVNEKKKYYEQIEMRMHNVVVRLLNDNKQTQIYTSLSIQL